jgi:hypothetical protein
MRCAATLLVASLLAGPAPAADVEVGALDQKPPKKEDLVAPKSDKGVPAVGLRETVKAKVGKGEKRHLYVVVTPVSNPDLANTWWVQDDVSRDGEAATAQAQFGEEDAGVGEYFAVVAVATDKTWSVGEKLTGLPADAACTKVTVVRRK